MTHPKPRHRTTRHLQALGLTTLLGLMAGCGDSDDNGNGNGADRGNGTPSLTLAAESDQRAVTLALEGASVEEDSIEILWSEDPDCDWGATIKLPATAMAAT